MDGNNIPPIAILAGGLATRLGPLAAERAKSMMIVAGEPFIAHQLRLLSRQGARRVVLCCGYMGEQIRDFVGDGGQFGCAVRYAWDGERARGTGGALHAALPLLGPEFGVLYGDSYLPAPLAPVAEAFALSSRLAMMTAYENHGKWDRSNIQFECGVLRNYDKSAPTAAMRHIDYGLSFLRSAAFDVAPAGECFDLAELFRILLASDQLAGCEVYSRFYEIGSPQGLAETEAYLRTTL